MLRRSLAIVAVAIGLMGLSELLASETVWKDDSPEAAERQLEKMRAAAGKLDRFEIECQISDLDNTFAKDELSRLHVYAEEGTGFRWEIRPVEIKGKTARRTASGGRCELSTKESETWVCTGDTCTTFHETQRSYDTMNVGPKSWFAPVKTAPHQSVPPWFDPSVKWRDLQSRYKIERAKSTETEFLIELSLRPRKKVRGFQRNIDERLQATHELIIDRRTDLPKQWRMIPSSGTRDRIAIFERIDVHPAKRDLKIVVTGYKDARKIAEAEEKNKPPAKDNGEPMRTIQFAACCFRVLTWCPF
jgi:hypothetical protein